MFVHDYYVVRLPARIYSPGNPNQLPISVQEPLPNPVIPDWEGPQKKDIVTFPTFTDSIKRADSIPNS